MYKGYLWLKESLVKSFRPVSQSKGFSTELHEIYSIALNLGKLKYCCIRNIYVFFCIFL